PMVAASAHRERLEIVISNNASPDNTEEVIREAMPELARHCRVRVYTLHENIGGEPNFRFLYEHARGTYVWSFSDRDILHPEEFDPVVDDLDRYQPSTCISSFKDVDGTLSRIDLPGGAEVALVTDPVQLAPAVHRYGKLSQYVHRRYELTPDEQAISEEASRGRVWFSVVAMMFLLRRGDPVLLRARIIGHGGAGGLDLMFSARVYAQVTGYIMAGVGDHPRRAEIERALPMKNEWHPVVGHLFRNALGVSRMRLEDAHSDYVYMKQNLRKAAFASWRNMVKVPVILLLFPGVYRRRLARESGTGVPPSRER
ncbi:MAG: glycosyltransferase, partial [Gemmatimonadetes bacterium]|nr:glycosyltransferase [Gemmatimonadota bacterium]